MGLSCAQLRTMVQIQQRLTGTDALGQPVLGWTTVAAVWADVRQMNGMQSIKADAEVSTVKASVRVRKRGDVLPGMRVIHGATVYEVDAVLQDEQDRMSTDLVCRIVT